MKEISIYVEVWNEEGNYGDQDHPRVNCSLLIHKLFSIARHIITVNNAVPIFSRPE